ncbi:L-rhamnose-binding lectin ELEL-1-like [Lepisosteus oculatus]|uniref:L-rhamnose-binding lectin ELEL-1-like n=1 Tax=Lepisosteus oculatus TaxID=7918 RepID=UPI0035F51CB5
MQRVLVFPCSAAEGFIRIHSANYGRTDRYTCGRGKPPGQLTNVHCYQPRALAIVSHWCAGRRWCTVKASNHVFCDPCYGTYKYLTITYSCVPCKKDARGASSTLMGPGAAIRTSRRAWLLSANSRWKYRL